MRCVYLLRFLGKYLPEKNLRVLRVRRKNKDGENKHHEKQRDEEKKKKKKKKKKTADIVYGTKS